MTTITVNEGCLKNVDKLQSLLKLRFDSFSGENITRGAAVNWAVNQQISTMTAPVNVVGGSSYPDSSCSFTGSPGHPIMVAYMATSPIGSSVSSISPDPFTVAKNKSRKGGGKIASGMGND